MSTGGPGLVDGLYRVTTEHFVAGFVIDGGRVTECAPILRKNLARWIKQAKLVGALTRPTRRAEEGR